MVFWRKKKNAQVQEQEENDDKILHPPGEPEIEPSTDYEAELDEVILHELNETETEVIDELRTIPTPENTTPESTSTEKKQEKDETEQEKTGGWLSRLTSGLTKSTTKISQGITDVLTKSKLDQEALDNLEDILIEADLGPKTAAKLIERLSNDRFGKDVTDEEVRESLASYITEILEPAAKPLEIKKPENGSPFVILVSGVNGVGKTTTIGKLAQNLHYKQGHSIMLAAGDTFRAAAIEQLQVWADRVKCKIIAKDVGADAAAVAFESYEQAKEENTDVLMIDTAGRLHNKSNLMDELQKIVRVLKKHNEDIPHSTLLVLDATTGQNAYAQLETFKDMIDISGLIVTKLDGSAKGGVLVGLVDTFGIPVHAIGVGESIEDLQSFQAKEYANSLMGIKESE